MEFVGQLNISITRYMSKKSFFGLSRSRDKSGKIIKRTLNSYVNCIHTKIGNPFDTMDVLVAEICENKLFYSCAIRGLSKGNWYSSMHKQMLEIGTDVANSITGVSKDSLILVVT